MKREDEAEAFSEAAVWSRWTRRPDGLHEAPLDTSGLILILPGQGGIWTIPKTAKRAES